VNCSKNFLLFGNFVFGFLLLRIIWYTTEDREDKYDLVRYCRFQEQKALKVFCSLITMPIIFVQCSVEETKEKRIGSEAITESTCRILKIDKKGSNYSFSTGARRKLVLRTR